MIRKIYFIPYVVPKIKKLFKVFVPLNSLPSIEYDLVSTGLWINLATYQSVFKYMHPYGILVQERKVFLRNSSHFKRIFLKVSTVLIIIFWSFTSFQLLWKFFHYREGMGNSDLDAIRIFVMFYNTFIIPIFVQTSVIIGFGPDLFCQVLNPIVEFGVKIRGKYWHSS